MYTDRLYTLVPRGATVLTHGAGSLPEAGARALLCAPSPHAQDVAGPTHSQSSQHVASEARGLLGFTAFHFGQLGPQC